MTQRVVLSQQPVLNLGRGTTGTRGFPRLLRSWRCYRLRRPDSQSRRNTDY